MNVPDKKRRAEKGEGIENERGVTAQCGYSDAADERANRQHRAPRRRRHGIGGEQFVTAHKIRNGCAERRVEETRKEHREGLKDIDHPDLVGGAHENQGEGDDRTNQVHRNHNLAAVKPVGDGPSERNEK